MKIHNYLRTLRREWRLTQQELASLLPKGNRNRVSQVERGQTKPTNLELVAYGLIFDVTLAELFPLFHADIKARVVESARRLHRKLEGRRSPATLRKRQLLSYLIAKHNGHDI